MDSRLRFAFRHPPQHFLYFFPLPHGHFSFLPTFGMVVGAEVPPESNVLLVTVPTAFARLGPKTESIWASFVRRLAGSFTVIGCGCSFTLILKSVLMVVRWISFCISWKSL